MDDLRWFEPPPAAAELPAVMPSPFAIAAPHPLAARAAAALATASTTQVAQAMR